MNTENLTKIVVMPTAWIVTITATILGIAPRLSPALFAAFAFLSLTILLYEKQIRSAWVEILTSPLILTSFAFAGYCLVNATWSADFQTAGGKALLIAAIVLTCVLTDRFLHHLSEHQLWQFVRGIVVGVFIGLFFLSFEFLTDHFLTRTLMNETLMSAGKSGIAALDGRGEARKLNNFYFNNQVSAINIVFWPTLFLAMLWHDSWFKRIIIGLLVCLAVPVTFMSESETAKVALILGAITYFATIYNPVLLHKTAIVLWSTAVLLVVPLVLVAYEMGLQKSASLPYSAKDRMHIWHYAAMRVPEAPFFGIGIRSTRSLKDENSPDKRVSGGKKLRDRTALHTHNSFLQTWHELGAVGAAFLLAIGLLMLRCIKSLSEEIRPYAYATFAATSSIAAFGFGMWQSWLMTTYAWTIIFLLVAVRYTTKPSASGSPLPAP